MKIKEQTRKLAAVSSKHGFEVVDKVKLTWFEEILEEY
ncbi:chlorohydrolase [Streptococcus pneumoniae]|nr:chlorohydrolase [Streptococcus pneumoniae]